MATQAPLETVVKAMHGNLTGESGEFFDFQFSGTELANGWMIIWSEDQELFDPPYASSLSNNFPLITCWVNETVMHSRSIYFKDGQEKWMILHEGDVDNFHIEYRGTPASDLETLIVDARLAQTNDPDVDYMFDVPLVVAQRLCSFKHDDILEDEPIFYEIKFNNSAEAKSETSKKVGWLSRIFGN